MGMSDQEYLDRSEVGVYVQDALRCILAARPKDPLVFLDNYLKSVLSCSHIMGKKYDFVSRTALNRRAFILAMEEAFGTEEGPSFSGADLSQLCTLICPDFPQHLLVVVTDLYTGDPEELKLNYEKLSRAFYGYFYYEEYFLEVRSFLRGPGPQSDAKEETVSREWLMQHLKAMWEQGLCGDSAVPLQTVEAVLGQAGEALTYRQFATALITNDMVIDPLLVLPMPDGGGRRLASACMRFLQEPAQREGEDNDLQGKASTGEAARPFPRPKRRSKKKGTVVS